MTRTISSVPLRRIGTLVAVFTGSLAAGFGGIGTASASQPSPTALVATVTANMKTVPVIQFSGSQSGMTVHGFYVTRPRGSEVSLSGTVSGTTIELSMVEIGRKNWMKANQAGWELFTLGTVPKSTLAQLSPTTWYLSQGSTTVDLGDSLCPTTSSTPSTCRLEGTKIASYSPSKAVISATSPRETITLRSVRGKLLPASIVAHGSSAVTERLSYPARAPKITSPTGAKPFPTKL